MPVSSAANSNSFQVTTPGEHAIVLTRLFDAPRAQVFEVLTRPEHIKHWWGNLGPGYSVPVCEADLRVGGKWRYSNQTPSGELATFYGVYHEITPVSRLVYTEIFEPFPDVESMVTTELTEEDGKTRMTVTAVYPSKDVRDGVLSTGMERGAALSYDRLEELAIALANG
ncbi:MAG TPA: SRPBCC family protein [Thermoanaerobaculia bacterium]|nr:SRPBCC family protein [Thermoanaerobaculia bacterium]